jgi:holo-[acyl-carrier protein] synthase
MSSDVQVCVGTDVESVADVADAIERYGERYVKRLYTEQEIATCGGAQTASAARFTARFAAKEAVIKLLAPTDIIPRWRSIEIVTAANGAPSIRLTGEAALLARERGLGPVAISMSHGAGIGMATAVALVGTSTGTSVKISETG